MSENIIPFAKPKEPEAEELGIWRCDCGCTSMYARSDAELECVACGVIATPGIGGWREKLPDIPDDLTEVEPTTFKVAYLGNAENFLKRHVKRAEDVTAAILLHEDGCCSTWAQGFDTIERREWLDRQLAKARMQMVPPIRDERFSG